MKKLLGLTVMLVAMMGVANAQKFNFGGKIGSNQTKISGQAFKDGYELGYHVGAFAEIDVTSKWGIQPEVVWNQTNTKSSSNLSDITNNFQQNTKDIKLNYLTIPILLRYNVGSLLTLNVGPQFGILLNKNETLWNNGKEAFKSGDLALVGGATVNLKMLRVYGRYNIGLNNLNDVGTQDKWKSQQLQLGVGISL
ncbi:porin family protein [Segetibacter sp.]|jgi:opacity protein-like surface antigen|uniref:porin family protein n=1 Tax=Segetibacter sp. TaxID=2231182 RepID=UPI00262376BA|nr:porin family protein [Segetibacter sp.]